MDVIGLSAGKVQMSSLAAYPSAIVTSCVGGCSSTNHRPDWDNTADNVGARDVVCLFIAVGSS